MFETFLNPRAYSIGRLRELQSGLGTIAEVRAIQELLDQRDKEPTAGLNEL